jgi:mannose-6-phosphate isomerase-like protein (cupin superfamily)
MRVARLENMSRGWFVGNFTPTLYATNDVEVAVKSYKANSFEDWHYHKIAIEITVVISGNVRMNGLRFEAGDIVILEPGEGADFMALSDAVTAVVKIPGANNDKYFRGE